MNRRLRRLGCVLRTCACAGGRLLWCPRDVALMVSCVRGVHVLRLQYVHGKGYVTVGGSALAGELLSGVAPGQGELAWLAPTCLPFLCLHGYCTSLHLAGDSVLELGCGAGGLCVLLAQRFRGTCGGSGALAPVRSVTESVPPVPCSQRCWV